MESLELNNRALRDPFGQESLYTEKLDRLAETIATCLADMADDESSRNRAVCSSIAAKDSVWKVVFGYAAGHDLLDVWVAAEGAFTAVERAFSFRTGLDGLSIFQPFSFSVVQTAMPTYALFAIAVCLAPQQSSLKRFLGLVQTSDEPEKLFDHLARVFDPERPLASAYPKKRYIPDWTQGVRTALSQPAEARATALAACMKNWPAAMRPFGLKTKPQAFYDLFPYFAFEIALSVCAYDIDDRGFRDHPFYPREFVDHYRTHIRTTRDAARPVGVDPVMPLMNAVRAPLADLNKSKRKGIARWLELASSGDGEAVEVVLAKVGRPRKFSDIWGLICALSEDAGHAIHADIKDDAAVAAQTIALAGLKTLGAFVPPEEPPAGPARVTQTLLEFDTWLRARGHRLVGLDNADDAVHAVVVRERHLAELLELSASLGMRATLADQAYAES